MGMVITAAGTATRTADARADAGTATHIGAPSAAGTVADAPASTVTLAGRAARDCLSQAQLSPSAVGVLVNVGVYRESNTFEPALAAMVQKEAGISLDYLADPAAAFSFDLMNGACGVLNAVQVGQALLDTAGTERLLITAADVHPGGDARRDPEYPYADLAGALLLERSADPDAGFGPVKHYTGDGPTDEGYLDTARMGSDGRSLITVRRAEDHARRMSDLAATAVTDYAHAYGIDLERTLVIGPGASAGVLPAEAGEPHTAAPVLGYLRAMAAGRPKDCDQLLFVTAGAGPSAACASYRPEGW
ncbi:MULTISPECIES: hypothetical protein [unclassified Streptomyces]|uniref:hypothetical protein n=1 Tax=unclassified Streptomyces TaxID=2593676 RepID=UPI001BE9097E|nr:MULTISPECIES: hypothetical protein [unclassified Streptomyces]MBT2406211.1 hypothetical protein [Streptomyces sp. ISL-21]MBT2459004.1 hypothetical protein [Streptomyces sp. ISL-86]MBT2609511.1 hypothetical protein [Streptomyces sp. ISL-87]